MLRFKGSPQDFEVEELFDLAPGRTGEYSYYRMVKRDLTTWRALRDVAEAFGVTSDRVAVAGLKDKVAVAVQHVSIRGGPPKDFVREGLELAYLGAGNRPVDSRDSRGNRFTAVMRGGGSDSGTRLAGLLQAIGGFGLPNYFDSQRFGSLRGGGEFPVRALLRGAPLDALKTILATTSRYDPPARRRQRSHVREHWGDWAACLRDAAPMDRRVLEALAAAPDRPWQAFRCIPKKLRLMFLHAYQSYLYNEILAEAIRRTFPAESVVELHYLGGRLAMPQRPDEAWRSWLDALDLPLPAPGVVPRSGWAAAAQAVLGREGLTMEGLAFPDRKDGFFRAVPRPARLAPAEAAVVDPAPAPDAVRVRFSLPPGTYATIVLKWLAAAEAAPGSVA